MLELLAQIAGAIINVTILVGGLYFVLKKPTAVFIHQRSNDLKEKITAAETLYQDSSKQLEEAKTALSSFENTATQLKQKMITNAENISVQIIERAKEMVKKIESDSRSIAQFEVEKAKQQLREEVIEEAFLLARGKLSNKIDSSTNLSMIKNNLSEVMNSEHSVNQ